MTAADDVASEAQVSEVLGPVKEQRELFAATAADALATQVGVDVASRLPSSASRTSRFVWYADEEALTLVVGVQEASRSDLALAIGVAEREERLLRLVLAEGWHEPTLHRWAWLRDDLPLQVWVHNGATATPVNRPSREHTKALVQGAEEPALHLQERTTWVESLMRWAGQQPDLDAAHRRDVRAWQCRGQRVLRIRRTSQGLDVLAGIDWGANSPHPTPDPISLPAPMTPEQEQTARELVLAGCEQRLSGVAHREDEHWLQAVLRRHPSVLGLEQPVLRELPAWRPSGQAGTKQPQPRGRGFVDLAGLDATGTLLLVETKLGTDDMLILQGLDYLIWAEANRERLTQRLDCHPGVPFEIAYCVGGKDGSTPSWSARTSAQLAALADDIRWHVQEVTRWAEDAPTSQRHPLRTFPRPEAGQADGIVTDAPLDIVTAELGSGTYPHELILVTTNDVATSDGWLPTTALHRAPDGTINFVSPWDKPFLAAGPELTDMWRYLHQRIVEVGHGNGYTYAVTGWELPDPTQIRELLEQSVRQLTPSQEPKTSQTD